MPSKVCLDPDTGIWTIELIGAVGPEEVAEAIGSIRREPTYRVDAPRLYDVREVEDSIDTSALRSLAHRKEFIGSVDGARSAIVVSRDITFGIARMYQTWMEGQPVEVRVFRDVDEARAWLVGAAD